MQVTYVKHFLYSSSTYVYIYTYLVCVLYNYYDPGRLVVCRIDIKATSVEIHLIS